MIVWFLMLPLVSSPAASAACNNATIADPWTDLDIGNCGGCPAGSATYDSLHGVFTIVSTRATISGTADDFNFLYRADISGDFDFRARLTSLSARKASAGPMVRANLAAGSRNFWLEYNNYADPGEAPNPAARTWAREWNDDATFANLPVPTKFTSDGLPQYQRIVRLGDQITGYWSSDGVTWNRAFGETLTDLPTSGVSIGMAVRSNDGFCGSVTAVYDQVTVTQPPSLPHQTYWMGNSLPGGTTHIQNDLTAMYLDRGPNKDPRTGQMVNEPRLYTNSIWDEAGTEAAIIDGNGKIERTLQDTHATPHRLGGYAITRDDSYIYQSMTQRYFDSTFTCNPDTKGTGCTACQYNAPGTGACTACPAPPAGYPTCGTNWYSIRKYNLDGTPASWGTTNGKLPDHSLRSVVESGLNGYEVRGLAAGSSEVYVSDTGNNKIRVYDRANGNLLRSFTFTRPGPIAIDGLGKLWIIQRKTTLGNGKVLKYTAAGSKESTEITDVIDPTAVTVAPDGKVWVTDDSSSYQQVRIFDASTGFLNSTLGDAGGIYSGTKGQVQAKKFNGPIGIGVDASGNAFVAADPPKTGTGSEIRKFDASQNLVWSRYGLEFIDVGGPDPLTDAASVYSREARYSIDYALGPGQGWTYSAMTLDRFTYPEDMRLHQWVSTPTGVYVRKSGGSRFLFVGSHFGVFLGIYRFSAGSDIAIPSGLFAKQHASSALDPSWPPHQPATGGWIWRNNDNDITTGTDPMMDTSEYQSDGADLTQFAFWYVDENMDIWRSSEYPTPTTVLPIKRYRFKGVDTYGNPKYYASNAAPCPDGNCVNEYQKPAAEFGLTCSGSDPCNNQVQRLRYVPSTDTMYLTGFTTARPRHRHQGCRLEFGLVGTEVIRYDNWSGTPTFAWRINDLPYPSDAGAPPADCTDLPANFDYNAYTQVAAGFDVAEDRVFVGNFTGADIRVYSSCNGNFVTTRSPGPEVATKSGLLDNAHSLTAYRRANGEYVTFAEEGGQAKILYYKVPSQTCLLCPQQYCTGAGIGCTATGACGPCGCCYYQCGVSIPSCTGADTPPVNGCQ